MNRQFYISLLFALLISSVIQAQTVEEAARNINAIKRDTTYLYAEATTGNLDSALYNAKAILEVKVRDWVRLQHPNEGIEVCIAKAKEHSFDVRTRRGNLQRAFVYVRKSDILPIANRNEVMVFDVAQQPDEEQTAIPNEMISEDTKIPEPEPEPVITLTADEQKMLSVTNLSELNDFVKQFRDQNRLNGYGKYTTMPKDADCHIFICNKQGNVVARFRHQSDGKVFNLSTLKTDEVANYGLGAIWFQIKEVES